MVKSQVQDPLTKALKNKKHQILLINRDNQPFKWKYKCSGSHFPKNLPKYFSKYLLFTSPLIFRLCKDNKNNPTLIMKMNISVSFHFFTKLVQELELLLFQVDTCESAKQLLLKLSWPGCIRGDLHSFSLLVLTHFCLTFDLTDQSNNL